MNTPSDPVYLAIDLGASSGRVIACTQAGDTIAFEDVNRFTNFPVESDGSYRWDADGLLEHIRAGLARAGERYGDRVAGIGVDTWGVDYGWIDPSGQLVEPPFAYRDPRNSPERMERAFERMPRRAVYDITGIQFMPINTLFQLGADKEAGRLPADTPNRLLFMPDLINYWLTGRMANEYTIASTGQVLNARTRQVDEALLDAMGIPASIFCEPVTPGTPLGELLPAIAEETGLHGVPVIAVGSHDTASAVAGVPAEGSGHAYLSSGTWSLIGIEADEPVINDTSYEYSFTNEGGIGNTIRLLKNITGLWLVQECRRIWAEAGNEMSFAELTEAAAAAEPFRAFINPDDPGFAEPGDMPERIRAACRATGQPEPDTPGAVIRVALDSLSLRCRTAFSHLEDLKGGRIDTLHIVGGGTRNRLLSQLIANAINRPIVAGPVEATAAGNVLVQMMATGRIGSLPEGRGLIRRSFPLEECMPDEPEPFERAYRRYQEVTSS